jgi:hypothetical protein
MYLGCQLADTFSLSIDSWQPFLRLGLTSFSRRQIFPAELRQNEPRLMQRSTAAQRRYSSACDVD